MEKYLGQIKKHPYAAAGIIFAVVMVLLYFMLRGRASSGGSAQASAGGNNAVQGATALQYAVGASNDAAEAAQLQAQQQTATLNAQVQIATLSAQTSQNHDGLASALGITQANDQLAAVQSQVGGTVSVAALQLQGIQDTNAQTTAQMAIKTNGATQVASINAGAYVTATGLQTAAATQQQQIAAAAATTISAQQTNAEINGQNISAQINGQNIAGAEAEEQMSNQFQYATTANNNATALQTGNQQLQAQYESDQSTYDLQNNRLSILVGNNAFAGQTL